MIPNQEIYSDSGLIDIDLEINNSIAKSIVVDAGAILTHRINRYVSKWGTMMYGSPVEFTLSQLEFFKGKRVKIIDSYFTGFDYIIDSRDE